MRKLTRDNKDVNKLDNVISSCACIANCAPGSAMREYYKGIQNNNAHAGGVIIFREPKANK